MNNFMTQLIDKTFDNEISKSENGYCPLDFFEKCKKYEKEDSFRGKFSKFQLDMQRDFFINFLLKK